MLKSDVGTLRNGICRIVDAIPINFIHFSKNLAAYGTISPTHKLRNTSLCLEE